MKYCVCSHFVLGQTDQGRACLEVQPEQTEPSVAQHHVGAKSKELKKDIEIPSQTFERVVDIKEAVSKSLTKDLSEAEEQSAMAPRSHLQNVDNLIGRNSI